MDKLQAEIDKVNELDYKYKDFHKKYLIAGSFKDIEDQADQECAKSQYVLSQFYNSKKLGKHSDHESFCYGLDSANQGNAFAQCYIGDRYFMDGEVKDGLRWYMKSAKQGNVSAQIKVAECYYTGKGVAKCKQKALAWLKLASKPKLDLAQNTLENDNSTLILENRDLIDTVKRLSLIHI